MAKRTPLYEAHVAAGAKIVDFAGWDMPIHYGSQLEEHHQVRRDAGMFDVSHMRAVDVEGKDAQAYLRRLVANDVGKLTIPGKALYSCMLKEDGGVIDDLIVYFFSPERYRVVVNAGTADKDLAWMRQQATNLDVKVADRPELAMIAVQGPNARERFWTAFPAGRARTVLLQPFQAVEWDGWLVARTGYTGEDGFEITLPAAQAAAVWDKLKEAGVPPIGLGARDTLRLEAGMNLYGQDMDERQNPLESGLGWTIDLKDPARDFIGRQALAALKPTRHFVGLVLLDRGVLRSHQKVFTAQGEGETTSGSFSPTIGKSIALARVPLGVAVGDTVEVEIRDKRLQAKVVKPNFARNGKGLI
ncbi:MAG TPA: glycine cleavage system aminomethyltransferase GcvT [Rhodocyclaceae bacterium]